MLVAAFHSEVLDLFIAIACYSHHLPICCFTLRFLVVTLNFGF